MLLSSFPEIQQLHRLCDDKHVHASWGKVRNQWATSLEVEYPTLLCRHCAAVVVDVLLSLGSVALPDTITQLTAFTTQQARAIATAQPRGHKLPSFLPEFKMVVTLKGSSDRMWKPNQTTPWRCPPTVSSIPSCDVIPPSAKLLGSRSHGATSESETVTTTVGIPWEPQEFVSKAAGLGHPKHFMNAAPKELQRTIDVISTSSSSSLAKTRTEEARKWMLRALQTKDEELLRRGEMADHCKDILAKKRLVIFGEMIKESGYGDLNLAADIGRGFDLMGNLPKSNVFEKRSTYAILLPEHVRGVSGSTRKAIIHSSRQATDLEMAGEVCKITLDEVSKGWLVGPLKPDALPEGASVTRRFGVKQVSSNQKGERIVKVRPIDDFRESLINSAVSSEEKISIHSACGRHGGWNFGSHEEAHL